MKFFLLTVSLGESFLLANNRLSEASSFRQENPSTTANVFNRKHQLN